MSRSVALRLSVSASAASLSSCRPAVLLARSFSSNSPNRPAAASLPPLTESQLSLIREAASKLKSASDFGSSSGSSSSSSASSGREVWEKPEDYDSRIDVMDEKARLEEFYNRDNLKPSELVKMLDLHIVGQKDAKRAVAVALRNRWRRHLLDKELREEVTPKNILMIGPTGSGKTEIARRLAKITDSPFIKVEATKFTEVGFYGKDVDSIIKDLVRQTSLQLKVKKRKEFEEKVEQQVEDHILDLLVSAREDSVAREEWRKQLRAGLLEDQLIEVEVPTKIDKDSQQLVSILTSSFGRISSKGQKKKCPISEARPLISENLMTKAMSNVDVSKQTIRAVEENGIVFIDEIDKICSPTGASSVRANADASAEGVQRDLLPLVEGTTVSTNMGVVHTDHILFICSGAFHSVKPSDLLPELQGRLPIRVELKQLDQNDLYHILTVPVHNLLRQQIELLKADQVTLVFEESAKREIARLAFEVNRTVENIGARRLNTIIQRICDEISFDAADMPAGSQFVISEEYVVEKVKPLLQVADLSRFIL